MGCAPALCNELHAFALAWSRTDRHGLVHWRPDLPGLAVVVDKAYCRKTIEPHFLTNREGRAPLSSTLVILSIERGVFPSQGNFWMPSISNAAIVSNVYQSLRALLKPKDLSQQLDLSKRPLPPENHTSSLISPPRALCPYLFTQRTVCENETPECTVMDLRSKGRR